MLTRRVIACLDVTGGRVVKGVRFGDLRDVGDPATLAARYEAEGADEVVFLDISATPEARAPLLEIARRTAERLFIPLTVGGGIRTADDVARALRSGADKVCINTAAVARPELISEAAARFGSQCVVASIDARHEHGAWRVYTHGGRVATGLEAVAWARTCVERGAGEILLTSIDRDGGRSGYDLALTAAVAEAVPVPVIASGGAGDADHLAQALGAGADAVLVAGVLHEGLTTVRALKRALERAGVPIRPAPRATTIVSERAPVAFDPESLDFAKGGGLVTVVAQDAETGAVLMVAHADREALERTLATGEMHYRSRTRGLWRKGETSGHVQRVVSLASDCDGDAVLARIAPAGPACHTGSMSCFGAEALEAGPLTALDRIIAARAAAPSDPAGTPAGYTRRLLADRNLRLKKLGEETAELVTACADEDRGRAVQEAADLVYHALVALRALGAGLADVTRVLAGRRR
jgi:cyclase